MRKYEPVAIIGYGCIFPPNSFDTEKFWENVVNGTNGIIDVSEKYWKPELYYSPDFSEPDKTYCKKGGKVEGYEFPFEKYGHFGFQEDKIRELNRSQQMVLDTILHALSMMKGRLEEYPESKIGVYVGNMLGDESFTDYIISSRLEEAKLYIESSSAFKGLSEDKRNALIDGLDKEVRERFSDHLKIKKDNILQSALVESIKELLHAKGIGAIVDGACSGSGLVIDEAIKSLHNGDNEICLASAVLGNMVVTGNVGFAKIGGLSKKNGSRPMDYMADGLIPGEGAGTLILKDLKKAEQDGDTIYAVIRGSGVASDGKGQSIYAPSNKGQLKAMRKSLERSGLREEDIDYIETHATGTMVGDKIELNTIKEFFRCVPQGERKIALGSIKSLIGHSFSAAGMANVIKVIEGMRRKQMPPTHGFVALPEGVSFEGTPLYINTEIQEWKPQYEEAPRRAMVNAFGFGGINANILLEEYLPARNGEKELHQRINNGELDIAIVGMGCMDSQAEEPDEWIQAMTAGMDEEKGYSAQKIEKLNFPFLTYKIPPKILAQIDRSQQLGLIVAGKAIGDYGLEKFKGKDTGVYVGSMLGLGSAISSDLRVRYVEYLDALKSLDTFQRLEEHDKTEIEQKLADGFHKNYPKVEEDTLPGYMDNIIAGRISNFYDFNGANEVCDCGFLSFSAALYQAVCSLNSEENHLAVVGGVHANMAPEVLDLVNELMEERGQENVPIMAEGGVFFVLKRFADVTKEDKVYARIHSVGTFEKKSKVFKCEGIESKGGRLFYLGAHEGFRLMKLILEHNRKSEAYIFEQKGCDLFGNGMYMEISGRKYEEVRAVKTAYFGSEDIHNIFDSIYTKAEFDKISCQHRAAIVYRTDKELEEKIAKSMRLIR